MSPELLGVITIHCYKTKAEKGQQPAVGVGVQAEENRNRDHRTFQGEKGRIKGTGDFSLPII